MKLFEEVLELKKFYKEFSDRNNHPTESEIETHLVTPLLQAFGWDRRFISFNRNCGPRKQADICLHKSLDRRLNEDVIGVIEVKKHHHFCLPEQRAKAFAQVRKYAENFTNIEMVFITDGYSYQFSEELEVLELARENFSYFEEYLTINNFKFT